MSFLLEPLKGDEYDFLRVFVTVDETWINHYTPGAKAQSVKYAKSEPVPKPSVASVWKIVATDFET